MLKKSICFHFTKNFCSPKKENLASQLSKYWWLYSEILNFRNVCSGIYLGPNSTVWKHDSPAVKWCCSGIQHWLQNWVNMAVKELVPAAWSFAAGLSGLKLTFSPFALFPLPTEFLVIPNRTLSRASLVAMWYSVLGVPPHVELRLQWEHGQDWATKNIYYTCMLGCKTGLSSTRAALNGLHVLQRGFRRGGSLSPHQRLTHAVYFTILYSPLQGEVRTWSVLSCDL